MTYRCTRNTLVARSENASSLLLMWDLSLTTFYSSVLVGTMPIMKIITRMSM